ncbi:MAG: SIR2 family protein, partial [Clostridiales bacterium]|nr:SIR2 family protein [Clostridiales bacterium]
MGGFEKDDDLTYVSDYYLNYRNKYDLLHLLKENFTIVNNGEGHSKISSLDWKRIYTTNYDDSIEKSAKDLKKIIYSLTIDDDPKEFYKKRNCCVHINGSISSVSEKDLDSKFKLTRTSYVSPDSFVNSAWYYYFKKDLEQCSAIVFIGYSLYDIDIEKILFASPVLKKKTYFIIEKNPPKKLSYLLSKYGQVLPIGVDGFADKIEAVGNPVTGETEFWTDSFEKYQLKDQKDSISDDQILNFILYGSLDKEYIENAISTEQLKPYLIVRRCLDEIEGILKSNRYLAILGDFGNGKSIILKETMATLSILGYQVFFLQNPDGDYVSDIEKISNLQKESILIIDDYSLNFDILLHIAKFNDQKIKVIFSDRSNNHDRLRKSLIDEDLQFLEISVDVLHQKEIEHFVAIIDNLGFWDDKANWPLDHKVAHIKDADRGQISHILLNLFNSPQIKKRIDSLLSNLIKDKDFKATIFSICLLEIINLPRSSSLISEVSGNDLIYKSDLRSNAYFNQLFQLKENMVISKSSLFSISLLKNFFSAAYITNKLLDLAEKYNALKDNGVIEKELFKSLLRFSFAERLVPEKGKLNSLVKYYEELKVRVGWLKFDPHFWLQYGMARMNYGQLEKAQSNLDEAYVLARSRQNYDTSYLDTQQARLYILQSHEESNGNVIWELFQKAHNLLVLLNDDIYKY